MRRKFLTRVVAILFSLFIIPQAISAQPNTETPRADLVEFLESTKLKSIPKGFVVKYQPPIEIDTNTHFIRLKYIEESKFDQLDADNTQLEWITNDSLPILVHGFGIEELEEEQEYIVAVGVSDGQVTEWKTLQRIVTKEKWDLFDFLILIGSLAMFLYGMKIMSDGLQQATGSRLRNLLGSMTSNPFKGILTGVGITTLVQSSSVTTVMTVSFVNAGILTLTQAAGVIMGANIGTTVTAWVVDLFGFKVDVGPYTLIILAIGLPMLFMNSTKTKGWANAIIGFAFLFMGLGFLKDAVPVLGPESDIVQFFVTMNEIPYISTIVFVLFGTILTVIIQSSSATMALTMALLASGVIPFEVGAAMVLGENIGTTITAEMAASVGNVHAKRTARLHSAFNIIGVSWVVLTFPFFIKGVAYITELTSSGNPIVDPDQYGSTGLAILHTTFNITNVLLMIWFIPNLVRLAERTVKSQGGQDEQFNLDFIGTPNMTSPALYISEAKKEIAKFGEVTSRMSKFTQELLVETDRKKKRELLKRIHKYEEITDNVEIEIANYLNNIATGNLTKELAVRIRGMNSIVSNLERIGDLFYKVSLALEKKDQDKIRFSDLQVQRINELLVLIDEAFLVMYENLKKPIAEVTITEAKEKAFAIQAKRDQMKREYYEMLSDKTDFDMQNAVIYSNIYESLGRIGGHIINVTEGIVGEV